jgi:hypothetical protein
MTSSGLPTRSNADPPAPGCLPGRRPLRRRVDRDSGVAGPSAEGGCEEFRELRPNCRFSSATSIRSSSINRACASITASNSSRDGSSDPDTQHDQHTPPPRSRTNTPKDHDPAPEWLPTTTGNTIATGDSPVPKSVAGFASK